jgi:hypothetical protein
MLPGGTDKVEAALCSCGIKDTTLTPIISHIMAKGKALHGGKSQNNANASQSGTGETTTQDSTYISTNHIDVLVRYFVLRNPRALISS